MTLRFGVQLTGYHPPAQQLELARHAEALGYESVWSGDHVSFHNPIHESITLLASYAPITKRIKLGVGVYLLALRSAAVAAKQAATLDVLSGGRLVFGVGVGGENPKEFELCGIPHKERGARVNEAIDAVRTLWRDTPASFHGRFTRFDSVSIDPKPIQQPVPIALGNAGPVGIEHAAAYADEWCPIDASLLNTGGRPDPAGGIQLFRDLAAEADRDPDAIPITLFSWGRPKESRLEQYRDLGVSRIVFPPASMSTDGPDQTLRFLDDVQPLVDTYRG